MLMKDNKKNMASIIVSKINDRDGAEGDSKYSEAPKNADGAMADVEMDGPAVAADEVFAALEAKDKGAFIEAMRSMVQMCMEPDSDDSGYESPE